MIKDDIRPITPMMMYIASHPSNPWMNKEIYQFRTDPIDLDSNLVKSKNKTNIDIDITQTLKPLDVNGNYIKYLSNKVRVE